MDKVEAFKNIKILEANRAFLIQYDHSYSSFVFKEVCHAELRKINKQIANIEHGLKSGK